MAARTEHMPRWTGFPGPRYDSSEAILANQRVFRAAAEAQSRAAQGMIRIGEEMSVFVGRRLRCDRKMLDDLARTRDAPDSATVWNAFVATAMRDYTDGFQRFMEICADQAREASADFRHEIGEAVAAARAGAPAPAERTSKAA
jgi:hypothetical protein